MLGNLVLNGMNFVYYFDSFIFKHFNSCIQTLNDFLFFFNFRL